MHCNLNIPLLHPEYYSTQFTYLLGWRTDYFSKHLKGKDLKNIEADTSLVVQWLRLHMLNARSLGSIPGQETRPHMPQLKIPHIATKSSQVAMTGKCSPSPSEWQYARPKLDSYM